MSRERLLEEMLDVPDELKLDFSHFHDLVHRIGGKTCRSQYGGIRRHIYLWWKYRKDMA